MKKHNKSLLVVIVDILIIILLIVSAPLLIIWYFNGSIFLHVIVDWRFYTVLISFAILITVLVYLSHRLGDK